MPLAHSGTGSDRAYGVGMVQWAPEMTRTDGIASAKALWRVASLHEALEGAGGLPGGGAWERTFSGVGQLGTRRLKQCLGLEHCKYRSEMGLYEEGRF